eukprot:EG_transcript_18394
MLSASQVQRFQSLGYLLLPRLIQPDLAIRLRDRYEGLFAGKFETGVYPDEWHWRQGLSYPDKAREIVNGWKCDRLVASVARSAALGRLAAGLMGWPRGARLGQDDVLWKPPGGGGIGFHQDSAYIGTQFHPYADNSVTVWIALDDADSDTGVVEYAAGSHRWQAQAAHTATESSFHAEADHRAALRPAAQAAGVSFEDIAFEPLAVPCGGAVLHHGDVWHGSGPNRSAARHRRALAVHLLRRDVRFRADPPPDYIYGRYCRPDSTEVDEAFFPVTFSPDGYRSPGLASAGPDPVAASLPPP